MTDPSHSIFCLQTSQSAVISAIMSVLMIPPCNPSPGGVPAAAGRPAGGGSPVLLSGGVSCPAAPRAWPCVSPTHTPAGTAWVRSCHLPRCRCPALATVASGGSVLPWVWCWSPGKQIRLMLHHPPRGRSSQPKSCLCFWGRLSTWQGSPLAPAVSASLGAGALLPVAGLLWPSPVPGQWVSRAVPAAQNPSAVPSPTPSPPEQQIPLPTTSCWHPTAKGCRTGSLCLSLCLPISCQWVLAQHSLSPMELRRGRTGATTACGTLAPTSAEGTCVVTLRRGVCWEGVTACSTSRTLPGRDVGFNVVRN